MSIAPLQASSRDRRRADCLRLSELHLRQTGDEPGIARESVGKRGKGRNTFYEESGGRMNNRIAQTYGYAVCLITVIVMLLGIKQVIDAAFDLSDPIRAEGGRYG